jgi:hypothetical protein
MKVGCERNLNFDVHANQLGNAAVIGLKLFGHTSPLNLAVATGRRNKQSLSTGGGHQQGVCAGIVYPLRRYAITVFVKQQSKGADGV